MTESFPLRPAGGRLRITDAATGAEAIEDDETVGRFRVGAPVVVTPADYELRGFGGVPVRIGEGLPAGVEAFLIVVDGRLVLVSSSAGQPLHE